MFKLSKRRGGDEVVQALHKVLFGRTSKVTLLNVLPNDYACANVFFRIFYSVKMCNKLWTPLF